MKRKKKVLLNQRERRDLIERRLRNRQTATAAQNSGSHVDRTSNRRSAEGGREAAKGSMMRYGVRRRGGVKENGGAWDFQIPPRLHRQLDEFPSLAARALGHSKAGCVGGVGAKRAGGRAVHILPNE